MFNFIVMRLSGFILFTILAIVALIHPGTALSIIVENVLRTHGKEAGP